MEVNPKLDKYLADAMLRDRHSRPRDRLGIIADYDPVKNTATVIMTDNFSDRLSEVIANVPCPTTIGVQSAAPEQGRGVWVAFDGPSARSPYIVSFTNLDYPKYDYIRQTKADTGVPRFMLDF
jgi:hypothetical protein